MHRSHLWHLYIKCWIKVVTVASFFEDRARTGPRFGIKTSNISDLVQWVQKQLCIILFMSLWPWEHWLGVPTFWHERYYYQDYDHLNYLSWSKLHTSRLKLCLQDVFSEQRRQSQTREILHHLEERKRFCVIKTFSYNLCKYRMCRQKLNASVLQPTTTILKKLGH